MEETESKKVATLKKRILELLDENLKLKRFIGGKNEANE